MTVTSATAFTLAIGLGVIAAIFTIVNTVLLRPLPIKDPDTLGLLSLRTGDSSRPWGELSAPEYFDLVDQSKGFEQIAAVYRLDVVVVGGQEPLHLSAAAVSASFWPLLEVEPLIGRTFVDEERFDSLVVLSHGLWQRQFGADPKLVGRAVNLDGEPTTVIGIMPPGLEFPLGVELWIPLGLEPGSAPPRGAHFLTSIARRAPGVTVEQAQAEVNLNAQLMRQSYPSFYPGDSWWGMDFVPLSEYLVGRIRPALILLLGAGALVLLVACANVANLRLNQALGMRKELALRAAFGASRFRILRQLVVESTLLAAIGAGLGVLFAHWGLRYLLAATSVDVPRIAQTSLDWTVFGVILVITGLVGLVTGVLPTFQISSRGLSATLKEEGSTRATAGIGSHRLRNLLVVCEIALALVVLIGAGLVIKNLSRLNRVDPGFDTEGRLVTSFSLPRSKYASETKVSNFLRQLLEAAESLPGIERAAVISHPPLSGRWFSGDFTIEGVERDPQKTDARFEALRFAISPGYFETMRIRLLQGRPFEPQDHADTAGVVIIDKLLARRFWPDGNPLGARLKLGNVETEDPWLTIVGVVDHVRYEALDMESRAQMYFPYSQYPRWDMSLVVKSEGAAVAGLAPEILRTLQTIDPDQPISTSAAMSKLVAATLSKQRLSVILLTIFATAAVLLAAVGIYSVLNTLVSERQREMSIRIAVGAMKSDVVWLVLKQGLKLSLLGIAIGLFAALLLSPRWLTDQLHNLDPLDPPTFAIAVLLVMVLVLLASFLPTRKATASDPMGCLREE